MGTSLYPRNPEGAVLCFIPPCWRPCRSGSQRMDDLAQSVFESRVVSDAARFVFTEFSNEIAGVLLDDLDTMTVDEDQFGDFGQNYR